MNHNRQCPVVGIPASHLRPARCFFSTINQAPNIPFMLNRNVICQMPESAHGLVETSKTEADLISVQDAKYLGVLTSRL